MHGERERPSHRETIPVHHEKRVNHGGESEGSAEITGGSHEVLPRGIGAKSYELWRTSGAKGSRRKRYGSAIRSGIVGVFMYRKVEPIFSRLTWVICAVVFSGVSIYRTVERIFSHLTG